ncbi:N-acetylmuramoyl-L-alanine amidase [Bacillus sp. OxB-1]|uniref:N-acetylmuramoyl-L-alanine amidase n=1 Tax=Bacillus sp. (strain OxB-1) TaxID=98228 RepID=UPI000581BA05|nr:N-acetylmuramoyl-L-alanine amidase [Bacillus sp. OxB-1]BAQ10104.1 N-acetylmuramoyl-L-alanine amidase [Bacillus sp. OxB-1]
MRIFKWAAVSLMLFTLLSIVPGQSSAQFKFSDINAKDEAFEEVHYIADLGIINKVAKFNPSDNLTRAQAAKMLVIASKKQNIPTPAIQFKDLKPGTEQYEYASRAVSLGYFKVGSDNRFKPNEKLKRDEMGYALAVAFNLNQPITLDHPMVLTDMASHPYAERINGLYYGGVTQGDAGKFLPNHYLTRKQFALFVARGLNDKYKLPVKQPEQTSRTYFVKVDTKGDTLNVRNQPSVNGAILGSLQDGAVVEVVGQSGDWLLVLLEQGEGYVNGRYTIELGTTKPPTAPENNDVAEDPKPTEPVKPEPPAVTGKLIGKATVNNLNVRAAASGTAKAVGKLNRGQKVEVISIDGYWAKIKFNSETAYVHKSYLKLINTSGNPLKDRIIVIDAGHGAHDPGASKNGLTEKAVNLKVAKLVESKLKKAGANVLMTRSTDKFLSLEERTQFAKKHYAEAFVSIHVNSAGSSSAKGTEVYFDSSVNENSAESKLLATAIKNNIVKRANMSDRGVKDQRFYVIRNNNVAAVLVELGFISNSQDFNKLASDEYIEIFAESIYQGLVQYYSAE